MAKLIGMSGVFKGREYPFDANGETTVGRGGDNMVVLDDPVVSGHHCLIVGRDGKLMLWDLGSTNGTRVNSRAVKGGPVVL